MDRPTAAGLAAVVLWSTTVAFSRTVSESLGPLPAGACVYALGGAVSVAAAAASRGGLRRMLAMPRRYLLGCGALFVAYTVLLYAALGMATTRPAVVAVGLANYLWPSLLLAFSVPVLGARARPRLVPGVALALAGLVLAATATSGVALGDLLRGGGEPVPVLLAAAAAVLWALYSNLARRWGPAEGSAVPLFLLASGAAFAGLVALGADPGGGPGVAPGVGPDGGAGSGRGADAWSAAPAVVYLALLPTWLAYRLWDEAMLRGDLALVTAASYFTPLLSTLVSAAVLGVPLTPSLAAAAALVTAGALLARGGVEEPG